MKRQMIKIGPRLLLASLALLLMFFVDPISGFALATVAATLTDEEKAKQDALLKKITDDVKKVTDEAMKGAITKEELEKRVKELNDNAAKLTDESMKKLDATLKDLSQKNEALQSELTKATDALKIQGEELKKLKETGKIDKDEKVPNSLRDAIKEAILEKKDQILTEKNDDFGKRLSMKDYFSKMGNRITPEMTIKVAVDMLESNIVQSNVATVRLTELDPMRVGIPLTIYPHVMDVFKVKSISRPYMSLLVVYSYEDGAGTKTEGSASAKSSFLFKTVEFKAFFIATHFVLSDETLDDLEEALDEISTVAPSKILDKIDSKILSAAGDDSSDIKGIMHTDKSTAFSNPVTTVIAGANVVDVIGAAKLQCKNNKYMPNVVYMSPENEFLLSAAKNTFEDSQVDRRVRYDQMGNPVSICGLRVITSTEVDENELLVLDNNQPWIGRRKDMTMEIGYNGTDLTEGQKTVVIKVRVAFGVRDKAGVIYVSSITDAIEALQTT